MIRLRLILLLLLLFGVATLWIPSRWPIGALEAGALLTAAVLAGRVALGRLSARAGPAPVLCAAMALWAGVQLAARWTAVPADTVDALLYWMAAASLVWVAESACAGVMERRAFLIAALGMGSLICFAGIVQLFTSEGRVFWLFPSGYESLVIGPFVSPNNFAAFVELLLPAALALGLGVAGSGAWLVVAAGLTAAVVASGSRAGTAVVLAEIVAAWCLRRHSRAAILSFAAAAAALILVVGYQLLWTRMGADTDPYALRREFLKSSLAMVKSEPLHGFGLGVWPAVYPRFATVDPGAAANHAHNEWAQWAAEGGLPALAVMLALAGCVLVPAVRSLWGLGALAVLLHSAVDYPFLRFGLAAWIFAWIGALGAPARVRQGAVGPIARLAACGAVAALAAGAFCAARIGWAGTLYRRATPEGVERAAALDPLRAEYRAGLAQLDQAAAIPHLERALALDPYLTSARLALAAEREQRGEMGESEAQYLEAASRDRLFAPAWAAANFYFRAGRTQSFWKWASKAAAIAPGDLNALFDLCLAADDDAHAVAERVVLGNPSAERRYVAYLVGHRRGAEAYAVAQRVAARGRSQDRPLLLDYVDDAVAGGRIADAAEIWNNAASDRPWRPDALVNGDFALPISNRGLDWHLTPAEGLTSAAGDGELTLFFSGRQPENCELLWQVLALDPGASYRFRFTYRTRGMAATSGVEWSLDGAPGGPLAASAEWSSVGWDLGFRVAPAVLRLSYRRPLGATRAEGSLELRAMRLERTAFADKK